MSKSRILLALAAVAVVFLGAMFLLASHSKKVATPPPPPPKTAPGLDEVRQSGTMFTALVKPEHAFIEIDPPAPNAELRHLLFGRINAGRYDHMVFTKDDAEFYFVAPASENRMLSAMPRARAAGPLKLTRNGSTIRLYADGREVFISTSSSESAAGQPLEMVCVFAVPPAAPAADTDAAQGAPPPNSFGGAFVSPPAASSTHPQTSLRVAQGPADTDALANAPKRQVIRVFDTAELRFSDDFMRTKIGGEDGWTVAGGRWRISQEADRDAAPNNFELTAAATDGPARITTGHRFWNNYRCEAAVEVAEGGALGIVFGETDARRLEASLAEENGNCRLTLDLVEGETRQELASRELALGANRWARLGVEASETAAPRVLVDGVAMIEAAEYDRAAFGRVGLCAAGKGGRLDDFRVLGLAQRPPADELRPVVQISKTYKDKPAYERDDRDVALQAWASDNDAWEPVELETGGAKLRGLLNSTFLFGDFEARLTPREAPQTLALVARDGKPVFTRPLPAGQDELRLRRTGGELLLGGQRVADLSGGAGVRLGLYAANGLPAKAPPPDILSRTVTQEFFETAPTGWRAASGRWQLTNRWACNPKWNFFGGIGAHDAILFSKNRYEGNQVHEFYHGMKDVFARQYESRRYARRDVGVSFCTNGRDLNSGYTFIWSAFNGSASVLLKGDTIVAWNQDKKFPEFQVSEDIYHLHLKWWRIRIEKMDRRIRVVRDGEVIFDWSDPDPNGPQGGHVAFWTVKNGIVYARIKSSAEAVTDEAASYLTPVGAASLAGWRALDPSRVRLEPAAGEASACGDCGAPGEASEGRASARPPSSGDPGRAEARPSETATDAGVRVRNLFGGGFFAVARDLPRPVDLNATPVLRLPLRLRDGARVNLHVIIGNQPMVFRVNAPIGETWHVLGRPEPYWDSWYTFASPALQPPDVEERSVHAAAAGMIEVDLRAEAQRRFPKLANLNLTSLIIGNSSNHRYLLAGFGGNTSAASCVLGTPSFLPAAKP